MLYEIQDSEDKDEDQLPSFYTNQIGEAVIPWGHSEILYDIVCVEQDSYYRWQLGIAAWFCFWLCIGQQGWVERLVHWPVDCHSCTWSQARGLLRWAGGQGDRVWLPKVLAAYYEVQQRWKGLGYSSWRAGERAVPRRCESYSAKSKAHQELMYEHATARRASITRALVHS